jgi:chromosomal replication initiation ATPase DnaA
MARAATLQSRARQIGMYLMHVSLGASLTRTGQGFNRDRTTARHACAVIEDWREDARIDYALDQVERALRHWECRFLRTHAQREAGS